MLLFNTPKPVSMPLAPLVITFEEDTDLDDYEKILHEVMGYSEGEDDHEDEDVDEKDASESDAQDGVQYNLLDTPDEFTSEENAWSASGSESSESKGRYIPGADSVYIDDEPEEPKEEPKITNWNDDRDVSHFTDYLRDSLNNYPKHDGHSISGCERTYAYISRLNNEISEAVRKDVNQELDTDFLEKARVKMMQDMRTLKEHMGKLKKKLKSSTGEDNSVESAIIALGRSASNEIEKEATVARQQMVITPFERAISGILINAVISAGHPFEDVYDFLKEKYKLDEREELALMQMVMDAGFPIFKDRGSIGVSPEKGKETERHGVDFIKTYFG